AGKVEDLRKRVEARQAQPLAELPARVLLAQLGLAGKDPALACASLDWLAQRLQKEQLQNTADVACHAAVPALQKADPCKNALPVVERAISNLSGQLLDEPTGSLQLALARFHVQHGNVEEGRKLLLANQRMLLLAAVRNPDGSLFQRFERLAREVLAAGLGNGALGMFR